MLMSLVASIARLPMYRFLVRKKVPKVLAIVSIMLLMMVMPWLIVFFIFYQLQPLIYDFDLIKQNILNHINAISTWLSDKIFLSTADQAKILKNKAKIFWILQVVFWKMPSVL